MSEQVIFLKCESDQPSYDQSLHPIYLERETDQSYFGKPRDNAACPTLEWPKFAWREIYGIIEIPL